MLTLWGRTLHLPRAPTLSHRTHSRIDLAKMSAFAIASKATVLRSTAVSESGRSFCAKRVFSGRPLVQPVQVSSPASGGS